MNDYLEILKVNGVNMGAVVAVSAVDLELALKILVLALTAVWTTAKIWKLCKGDKPDKK